MKKMVLLSILFTVFAHLTAYAHGDNVGETIGYVIDIEGDVVHFVGEPVTPRGFSNARVSIGGAPVYDLRTGYRVSVDDIMVDDDIRIAYHVPLSQSGKLEPYPAVVAWLNWDCDTAAVFTVVVSDNISSSEESTVFLCENERYRVAITPDTIIQDQYSGRLTPADIHPGMEFFVWVDVLTASTPALVYPHKVVVVY
ncbi:MAG: hypothetical protein FWF78_09830 [Defluviitaleaceae bacterium]|nr:hypothetical protein [Defluviitaleaceae bacterium]